MNPRSALCWSVLALSVSACNKQEPQAARETQSAQASAQAAVAPSAQASDKAPEAPAKAAAEAAQTGVFQGSYDAKAVALAVPDHIKWRGDDEPTGQGAGTIELTIEADGRVHGKASGALGDLLLRGRVDAFGLSVELLAADAKTAGYFGTLVAKREGDGFSGVLRAAPYNGALIRESAVLLKKRG